MPSSTKNQISIWMLATTFLVLLLVHPAITNAQEFYSEDFSSKPNGSAVSSDNWLVLGSEDNDHWRTNGSGLDTGDLNNFLPGLSWVVYNSSGAKSWTDSRVTTRFRTLQDEGAVAVAIRFQDTNNYYYGSIRSTRSGGSIQRFAELKRMVNGIPLDLGSRDSNSGSFPKFENTEDWHVLSISAKGTRISLHLDGTELLSANDSNFANGSGGIGAAYNKVIFQQIVFDRPSGALPLEPQSVGVTASSNSGAGDWRVLAKGNMAQRDAESLSRNFVQQGFFSEAVRKGNTFSVYIGRFETQVAAQAELNRLRNEDGLLLEGVENAPAAAEGGGGGSSLANASQFRVKAGSFSTLTEAQAEQSRLQNEQGIYLSEIESTATSHDVFIGFAVDNRADAEAEAKALRDAGITNVEVVGVASLGSGVATLTGGINQRDRGRVEDIINQLQREQASGRSNAQLNNDINNLSPEMRAVVEEAQRMLENQAERQRQTAELSQQVDDALNSRNYDEAVRLLRRWIDIDPGNAAAQQLLTTALRQQGQASATPAPVQQTGPQRNILLMENARQAEANGNLEEALRLFREVRQNNPTEVQRAELTDAITRIEGNLTDTSGALDASPSEEGGSNNMVMVIIVVVVIVIAVLGFIVLKRGKKKPANRVTNSATTMASLSTSGTSGASKKTTTKAPSAPTPAVKKSEKAKEAAQDLGSGKTDSSVSLGDALVTEKVEEHERIRPGTFLPSDGTKEDGDVTIEPPVAETKPVESGVSSTPDLAPVVNPSPPSGVQATDPDLYFEESFEASQIGEVPKKWKGEYDYASLLISDQDTMDGSTRCLRFEKKKGTGSAYYACRFPDSTGRVKVEFDFCCPDKNKYLLGFYIEKDEDFRHSIHTVVHRDMSKQNKVTLRLQNESVPYELGKWVHVSYSIDLQRNLVDGYVDGEPVAMGVRLASRPKMLNTLSIRDNLATEGILLIDNIRITRERG